MPDTVLLRLPDGETIELARGEALDVAARMIASGNGRGSLTAAATIIHALIEPAGVLVCTAEELRPVQDALLGDLDH